MKAAVVTGLGSMQVMQVSVPKLVNESILLRVLACAVCGSDIRILDTGNSRVKYPAIIGHEIAGEVVEVGKEIDDFRIGDKVAIGADVPCGRCEWCQNGMGNCCGMNYAIGYQFQGGFAEYCLLDPMVVRYGPICHIPEGVNLEHAALAEPLACCINGLERVFFAPGKSVLVIGAGPIGILLTQLAQAFGSPLTILYDIDPKRLEMAQYAQADYYIDASTSDLSESVMEITRGRGADLVFTACPSPDAQEDAVKVVAKRGFVNFFGGLAGAARSIRIRANDIHYKELYITGSHGSTPRQHAMALDLIAAKRVDLSKLVTHRFALDDIHKAFDTVRNRIGLRVVVRPNG